MENQEEMMRKHAMGLMAVCIALTFMAGCSNKRADQSITTEIKARLFSDPQARAANIEIATENGVATLSGTVPDQATRSEVVQVAAGTPGVNSVNDRLTLEQAETSIASKASSPAPAAGKLGLPSVKRHTAAKPVVAAAGEPLSRPEAEPAPPAALPPAAADAPVPASDVPSISAATPPPAPQPRRVEIPAGTSVRVQMIDGVDSSVNHAGESFHGSLDAPIVLGNEVVVPAGTDVYIKLVDASSAGHITGKSELSLDLVRMEFQGKSYMLESDTYQQAGASRGKRSAETIGGGAALGALLGAVIGHGKGAAIGAVAGAGAGTVAQTVTHGEQVRIPAETKLDFNLAQPVSVSYFPEKNRPVR
jgi:hypothetical protein